MQPPKKKALAALPPKVETKFVSITIDSNNDLKLETNMSLIQLAMAQARIQAQITMVIANQQVQAEKRPV